jgi:hypothetical protein
MNRRPQRLVLLACAVTAACAPDFDTSRAALPRGSLGQELFIALCDRVAAQALAEDVTGASWHAVCHPDASGAFATRVDASRLVPLDPSAVDTSGVPVSIAEQEQERGYHIARIEALARDRVKLTAALDAAFPDVPLPLKDLANADPSASCNPAGTGSLPHELAQVLGRMKTLEDDGTLPLFSEALGRLMSDVDSAADARDALARLDARQGYRPLPVDLGVARPLLSYPRLAALVQSVVAPLATDSDPYNPAGAIDPSRPLGIGNRRPIPGDASAQMQQLLAVGREELRTAAAPAALDPLNVLPDPNVAGRTLLSRPRTTLEVIRRILLSGDPTFDVGLNPPAYVALRDPRGDAAVPLVGGAVPSPFVDDDGDGLPDIDSLGRFVSAGGQPIASPFYSPDGADGPRDSAGRAIGQMTPTLYAYVDVGHILAAKFEDDLRPLLDPDPTHGHEAVMGLVGGAYVLFGARDPNATTTRQYAPDPQGSAPTAPVALPYRAFHPDTSPLLDLVYALGVMMADPAVDDVLQLARALVTQHPAEMARLVGLGLKMKAIADAHPEAHFPAESTLWDELLDVLAEIAHVHDTVGGGGILEDLLLAFGQDATVNLQPTFAAYLQYRDALTYDHHSTSGGLANALNGPAWDLTSNGTDPMHVPVDRTQPDTSDNRSALQRFMQLLHDAKGLGVCTKAGAVAHVQFNLGVLGTKTFDYPTDPLSGVACTLVGAPAPPNPMPACGILRIRDVDALLLDVALDRAQLDIRDPCLVALMKSPLTNLVGGVDPFLEAQSGIAGFDTHPTVQGIARLLYFETPHGSDPGDTNPATMTTYDFLKDVIDPVATTVCSPAPFTDSDGTVVGLRTCSTFADTMRGRDPGFLFPVEQLGFVQDVQPLAAAFDDHGQALLFVDLFDTLHLHWGSEQQPPDLCDPTQPRASARWCSQDGVVRYEPLLIDILLHTDVLQTLHDVVPVIQGTTIVHCDAQDPMTHACTKTSPRTGVQVLAQAVRVMVDPAYNQGLTDRHGVATAPRNDGATNPQVTPIYLFVDALKGIDDAFASWAAIHPGDDRQPAWRAARSQFVDQFLGVTGSGAQSAWADPAIPAALATLVDAAQEQILARCPDRSSRAACMWWPQAMPQNLADVVSGPTFAAVMDLVDAIRTDSAARTELEQLLQYLLDPTAPGDARAATMTASVDALQVFGDDANLVPLYHAAADTLGAQVVGKDGTVARRGLAGAAIELFARVYAAARDARGNEICSQETDPNGALAVVLAHLVTPAGSSGSAPIEAMIDIAADVNRAHPEVTGKLDGADYGNIAKEVRDFCLDPASGLEQVYTLVRQATLASDSP